MAEALASTQGARDAAAEKAKEWVWGWRNGEWKCPHCKTIIGKNLNGEEPWGLVQTHKCQEKT